MFYFKEHQWLMENGTSRFQALINADMKTREEVHWELEMRFVASGAVWRRVRGTRRANVWITVSSFRPPRRSWEDLEASNYWNLPEDEYGEQRIADLGGFLDFNYMPNGLSGGSEVTSMASCMWRVAGREAGWFTVEMAAFADGSNLLSPPAEESWVLSDGSEERPEPQAEPDADFYRKHAEFYVLERVPFGLVMVRVPRNVRDAEAFAVKRARDLIGVPEPEHIEVTDFAARKSKRNPEKLHGDLHVKLHFNGFYDR
jgi:hypothetical protein